jgi:hypothetical protein
MKKYLLLLSIIILSSCYNIERNCKNFKTGKFKFENTIKGIKNTTYFIRTDSIEIETYNGKTDTSTVRWVGDGEYILKKIRPKSMMDQKSVVIKILTTTKNSYTFEYGFVGSEIKQRGTVTKIE